VPIVFASIELGANELDRSATMLADFAGIAAVLEFANQANASQCYFVGCDSKSLNHVFLLSMMSY